MNGMHYVGLDIHKKTISWCVRQADGSVVQEGKMAATREALDSWMQLLPQPWIAGMEATIFSGWIYDHLVSCGATVKVAHTAMLQAIAAGKKKNDCVDARKISDLLRCDYFPECHMAAREFATSAALSQPDREAGSTDEEQSEWAVDGSRCAL
jgi:transposase